MGARSTIARLPKELADLCHRLIREGRTIHEITDALNTLDAEVSKSAVGRYVKSAREQMERYREAQVVAGQWVTQLNENPAGDVSALLAEMLKVVAFQTIGSMGDAQGEDADGKVKPPKAMDIMLLAKAIRDLESSTRESIKRQEETEKRIIEKAAKKAGEVGVRVGLSQATIDEIQKELRLL